MTKTKFFIGPDGFGVVGDPAEALAHPNAPEHKVSDYREVSQREYEDTVLDMRYEGGDWFQ